MSNTLKTISTCCDDKNSKEEHYLCCVDEVGDSVKRIVRNFQLFERDQVKTLGFTMSQCYTLIEMLETEAMTMHELSEKMNLNSSTMTRSWINLSATSMSKEQEAQKIDELSW